MGATTLLVAVALLISAYLVLVSLGIEPLYLGDNALLSFIRSDDRGTAAAIVVFAVIASFVILRLNAGGKK